MWICECCIHRSHGLWTEFSVHIIIQYIVYLIQFLWILGQRTCIRCRLNHPVFERRKKSYFPTDMVRVYFSIGYITFPLHFSYSTMFNTSILHPTIPPSSIPPNVFSPFFSSLIFFFLSCLACIPIYSLYKAFYVRVYFSRILYIFISIFFSQYFANFSFVNTEFWLNNNFKSEFIWAWNSLAPCRKVE